MKEKIEEAKRLLIIVDAINGFLKEGALADTSMQRVIPNIIKLVEDFMSTGDPIIAFRDAHTLNSIEFKKFPKHCIDGEFESELVDELKPYEWYFKIFKKNSTSGYVLPEFRSYTKKFFQIEEILIGGVLIDVCDFNLAIPLQNHYDQKNKDVKIIVPKNIVDTYDAPWHNRVEYSELAFKLMKQAGIETPDVYRRELK